MTISHMGLAVVLLGVAGSLAWRAEYLQVMHPGRERHGRRLPHRLHRRAARMSPAPITPPTRGTFIVSRNGQFIAELQPERRVYANPPRTHIDRRHPYQFRQRSLCRAGRSRRQWRPRRAYLPQSADALAVLRRDHDGDGWHRFADRPPSPHRRAVAQARRAGSSRPAIAVAAASPIAVEHRPKAHAPLGLSRAARWVSPCWPDSSSGGCISPTQGITPNLIPSVMIDKPAPNFDLPPLLAERARIQDRGSEGQGDGGELLRVVVRALPRGASDTCRW